MPIRHERSCRMAMMRNRRVQNSARKPVTKSMKLYVFYLSFFSPPTCEIYPLDYWDELD